MRAKELRERLQGIPDAVEVELALLSKDGQRQVLRRVASLEYRFDKQQKRDIVALIGYKSLKQQRQRLGDLAQETRELIAELKRIDRQREKRERQG